MSRIPLGYYIAAGLLFWGLPGTIVAGPWAIAYTFAAVIPVLWFSRDPASELLASEKPLSTAACTFLALFSLGYLVLDATVGRHLLEVNVFLHHTAALDREIDTINETMSKGSSVAFLLGYIFALLPLALIDASRNASRRGRVLLWTIAIVLLFYYAGAGRGYILMVVAAVLFGRTSDWRRIAIGSGVAFAFFTVASTLRGDTEGSPMVSGIVAPFINLSLMLHAGCGTAPWYFFLLEFLKKFLPAFLIPKTVFSFNLEMSLCIYPSADQTVTSVSIFTWLGEIFYYTPSILTATLAGVILGYLSRVANRSLTKQGLYSARLFAGLLCFYLPRSRTQDMFTFLIAQILFLSLFWPQLRNLGRTLYRFLPKVQVPAIGDGPKEEPM